MTDAVLDDPSDELLTALEILAEEAQLWTNGVPTEHDEFYAAVSAVLLLVPELLDEYSAAWIGLAELRQVGPEAARPGGEADHGRRRGALDPAGGAPSEMRGIA